MERDQIVDYFPGSYDKTMLAGNGPFMAIVTRVRESGLVDVVFGDDAGMGAIRTSVGVGAPSVAAEGYVEEIAAPSLMGGGGPGEEGPTK